VVGFRAWGRAHRNGLLGPVRNKGCFHMRRLREPDEIPFFHVERHHCGREQTGTLARDHRIQEQTGIIEGRPAW
jgi:hypothetical protein